MIHEDLTSVYWDEEHSFMTDETWSKCFRKSREDVEDQNMTWSIHHWNNNNWKYNGCGRMNDPLSNSHFHQIKISFSLAKQIRNSVIMQAPIGQSSTINESEPLIVLSIHLKHCRKTHDSILSVSKWYTKYLCSSLQ